MISTNSFCRIEEYDEQYNKQRENETVFSASDSPFKLLDFDWHRFELHMALSAIFTFFAGKDCLSTYARV